MAFARVVTFEGVGNDRIEEMRREMQDGDPPEGLPAKEIIVLHDAEAEKSLAIVFFENRRTTAQRPRRSARCLGPTRPASAHPS